MSIRSPESLLHHVAVRITTRLCAPDLTRPDIFGSGVIYYTTEGNDHMYVFTALHCVLGQRNISEQGITTYQYELLDIEHVAVEHNPNLETTTFKKETVSPSEIIIDPRNDFCILKVKKVLVAHIPNFPRIVIHKNKRTDGQFRSAGFLSANERRNLTFINYKHPTLSPDGILAVNAEEVIHSEDAKENIGGYSGSGLLMQKGPVLVGIVTKLNDKTALANNVHARDLSLIDINTLLSTHQVGNELVVYTNDANHIFNEDSGEVIDLSKVPVNGVTLNLWKAVGNIKKDIADDWFQDPQRYKDILYSDNLYKLFKLSLIYDKYEPSSAELYNIPKEGFTIRKALQTSLIDRVIYQAAVDYIAAELDHQAICENVYSVRYNYNPSNNNDYFFYHSVEQWRKFQYQIHNSLTEEAPYLVVTDITGFYDNINLFKLKTILAENKAKVQKKGQYDEAVKIIMAQLTKWQELGIPQNREPSAFLANLFLAKVDNHMINQFPRYYRYMDDIRIICKNKFEARRALMVLIDQLTEIGLNLNSQKTKILNNKDEKDHDKINEYTPALDKEIEQICSLMDSGKSREVQIAVMMVNDMFHASLDKPHDIEHRKKFKFAIERLQRFSRTPILCDLINFSEIIKAIIERFEDNPWYTEVYTRFLMTIDKNYITEDLLNIIVPLVIEFDKNIYPWQSYQLLKLLAYHKIGHTGLQHYANSMIANPQGSDKAPIVAGACLYLASVDDNAIGSIKSAFVRGHFKSHLSNRCALVCLQTIAPEELEANQLDNVQKEMHRQAYDKYIATEKIAPYVYGFPKLKINHLSRDLPQVISLP